MRDNQEEQVYEETLEGRMRALGKAIREVFGIDKLESWVERVLSPKNKYDRAFLWVIILYAWFGILILALVVLGSQD